MLFALIWRYRTNKINVETELKALEKSNNLFIKKLLFGKKKKQLDFHLYYMILLVQILLF
jgi:hypothetical protein